jgi:hypothetical protein
LQLKLISMGKSAGFSLEEIAGMFGRNGMPDLPRGVLHQKADGIDRQIVSWRHCATRFATLPTALRRRTWNLLPSGGSWK